MSNHSGCPAQHDLQRLMLGLLPGPETANLAEHIETCEQCIETIRTLSPSDTLMAAMQRAPRAAPELPTGQQVQTLIDQVCQLVGQSGTGETTAVTSLRTPAPAGSPALEPTIAHIHVGSAVDPETYDFLAPPQSPDELGRLGVYRVRQVLGVGGMGIVFLAEDPHLERQVALKVMKPALAASESEKKRFLREAKTAAAIEHDHIVGIYHVGQDRGVPYLAMPLLRGESLEDRLQRDKKLPLNETLRIGREIAEGLAAAHERGLVHRDIKPANIWLETTDEGRRIKDEGSSPNDRSPSFISHPSSFHRVKILDFGLARAADDSLQLTQPGAIPGTPGYMAPEQAHGESIDQRCDLFSLGCVLYRCATGRAAFEGKNAMTVLMAVTQSQPKSVRSLDASLPVQFEKLIARMLEKDPADRCQTSDEVAAEIASIECDLRSERVQPAMATSEPKLPHETLGSRPEAIDVDTPSVKDADECQRKAALGKPASWRRALPVAAVVSLLLLTAVVFYIQNDEGTLIVTIDDDDIEATLKRTGLVIRDARGERSFTITTAGRQRRPAGTYTVRVNQELMLLVMSDDGLEVATNEFKLTRRGKVRIRVTRDSRALVSRGTPPASPPPDVKPIVDPEVDRRAAIQVVKLKGVVTLITGDQEVTVNGRDQQEPLDEIPQGVFTVTYIDLRNDVRKALPEGGLEPLADLRGLKVLKLEGTEIGGDGLQSLAGITSLESLHLGGCKLNDADLVHLRDLTNLTDLNLDWNAGITGSGFVHWKGLRKLKKLSLYVTNTTDAGLAHLAELPDLDSLVVHNTQVTGTSFPKFITWPRWKIVYLRGGNSPSSRELLPALKVNAALQELSLNMAWTDDDLAHLATNKELRSLTIDDGQAVTNRGLAYLSGLTKLRLLEIRGCQATDEGLDHLLAMQELDHFAVPRRVTDKGIAKLRALKKLRVLGWRSATDDGLALMKDFPNLGELWLQSSDITDDGLRHLHGLPKLAEIGLTDTRVTTAGIEAFRASYSRPIRIVRN